MNTDLVKVTERAMRRLYQPQLLSRAEQWRLAQQLETALGLMRRNRRRLKRRTSRK